MKNIKRLKMQLIQKSNLRNSLFSWNNRIKNCKIISMSSTKKLRNKKKLLITYKEKRKKLTNSLLKKRELLMIITIKLKKQMS